MDIVIVILIVILLILGGLLYLNNNPISVKSKAVKKEEIIAKYSSDLREKLANCQSKEEKIEQKKIFLQGVSSELSRNIFFTEDEAKKVIQKLAVM